MNSYNFVTPLHRSVALATLLAIAVVTLFGMSLSAAQEAEPEIVSSGNAAPAASSTDADVIDELVRQLEERDMQIGVLHEQLAVMQQAVLASEHSVQEHRDTLLDERELMRTSDRFQDDAMAEWRMGYLLGGGQNLRAFESIILPCESGGEPDPDAAVGPTDDWGRAQINRPTWSKRFTELTGAEFEDHISNPILNGFMAAHVETEQGLRAWTCWRKR